MSINRLPGIRLTNCCFKPSQKETSREQSLEVLCKCHEAEYGSPAQNHHSCKLACWKLDQEVCDNGLHNKLCHINDRTKPRVILATKMSICHQTEHAGVGESRLVEALKEVDCEHNGQNGKVDLFEDAFVLLWGDDDGLACMLEELGSFVLVREVVSAFSISMRDMFNSFDLLVEGVAIQLGVHAGGVAGDGEGFSRIEETGFCRCKQAMQGRERIEKCCPRVTCRLWR